MLTLALREAKRKGQPARIAAARNLHKSALTAAALLDLDICFVGESSESYLACRLSPDTLEDELRRASVAALYLTSPDYLGNLQDIATAAEICHRLGILLLVDNAHGAYLHFLAQPAHPIDLGADICCDSAHKTLPALTGAAYLHIARTAPAALAEEAKEALALYASTSPSYLTLASLDALNPYLAEEYPAALAACCARVRDMKAQLATHGYTFIGDEAMKITLAPKPYGYRGEELAALLRQSGTEPEFADPDYLVLMPSPQNSEAELARALAALLALPRRAPITEAPPRVSAAPRKMSVRKAVFAPHECIPVAKSEGRTLASLTFSCPPAVPVLVAGEEITPEAVAAFNYYGIREVVVIK